MFERILAMQVNVQLFWKVIDTGEEGVLVKAGTPLAQFVPVLREHIEKDWYDFVQEPAEQKDWDLENSFNYSLAAEYSTEDTVTRKIARAMRAINYHSDGTKR